MPTDGPISASPYRERPPRDLSDAERSALIAIADALVGPSGGLAAPSATPHYARWLDRALAARRDVFEEVVHAAIRINEAPDARGALRDLSKSSPTAFQQLSTVVAGAYLLVPAVRREIGYPGQERSFPRFDEAADEIMSGILDPVIERGPRYRVV